MSKQNENIEQLIKESSGSGADTPGFLDGVLYGFTRKWHDVTRAARELRNSDRELPNNIYTGRGYIRSEGRDPEISRRIDSMKTTRATDRIERLSEEEIKGFSLVKSEGDFESQEQFIEDEREGAFLSEQGDWTAVVGEFIRDAINPITLLELGAIGKGVAAVTKFGQPVAKAFASWANKTFGTSLEFAEIVSGETAKKVLGAAGHGSATAAVYIYVEDNLKKYIGTPIENIGSNMAWNGFLGACLGGAGGYIGSKIQARKIAKNREKITKSFIEDALNDFPDSEIKVEWSDANSYTTAELKVKYGDALDMWPKELEGTVDTHVFQKVTIDGSSKFSKYFYCIPTVRGLNSESSVVRRITDGYFRHQYIIKGRPIVNEEVAALAAAREEAAIQEIRTAKKEIRVAASEKTVAEKEKILAAKEGDVAKEQVAAEKERMEAAREEAAAARVKKADEKAKEVVKEKRAFSSLPSVPIESEMTQYNGLKYQSSIAIKNSYNQFRKEGYGNRERFNEDLCRALLSRDKSENHIIAECAVAVRKLMKILYDEAIRRKIFPEVSKGMLDESYLPRIYDLINIKKDPDGWERTFKEAVRKRHPDYSESEITEYFENITDTIKVLGVDDIPTIKAVQSRAKVTKGRKVDLESLDLFEYLVKDPERLMDVYFTGLGFEVAQKRVLDKLGYKSFDDAYNAAKSEFHEIARTLSGKERAKFEKKAAKDLELLKKMPKLVTGQISSELRFNLGSNSANRYLSQALSTSDMLNASTLLGKVFLSCLEDLSITATDRGLPKHMAEMWMHKFGNALKPFSKEELHRFGIAVETLSGNINILTSPSKTTKMSSAFWKLTLAPQFDDCRAFMLSSLYSQEIASDILKGNKFTTRLNENSIKSIRTELQRHAVIGEHGIEDMNISSWESFDAKRDFMAEVERHVRRNIPNPGAGDVPIFAKSPSARLVSMFMGYVYAVTNQVVLPWIDSGKKGYLKIGKAFIYWYAMSMLTNIIRGYLRGDPYDLKGGKIHRDSIARVPILGLLEAPIRMVTGLFADENERRHSSRAMDFVYDIVKGGSLRWPVEALDAGLTAYNAWRKKGRSLTATEKKRMLKVCPFVGLFYIQPVLDHFYVGPIEKRRLTTKNRWS